MAEPILRPAPPGGVPYRLKLDPEAHGLPVLMLHGWSGDENVMWVLETVLPAPGLIAAPRGAFPIRSGGYQWSSAAGGLDSALADFDAGVGAVQAVVEDLIQRDGLRPSELVLMGFSQGAALCFALACRGGLRPRGVISLAGFVPRGGLEPLQGVPVYWGHGTHDERVPIARAHEDLARLQAAGAAVDFCEADVGHRLGIECTRGLKRWFERAL